MRSGNETSAISREGSGTMQNTVHCSHPCIVCLLVETALSGEIVDILPQGKLQGNPWGQARLCETSVIRVEWVVPVHARCFANALVGGKGQTSHCS